MGCARRSHLSLKKCRHSVKLPLTTIRVAVHRGRTDLAISAGAPDETRESYASAAYSQVPSTSFLCTGVMRSGMTNSKPRLP